MMLVRWAVIAASLGVLAGCSSQPHGGPHPREFATLQDVSDLLHTAAGATRRVPGKVEDLDRFKARYPHGYAAVKSGDVVVLWGATLQGEGAAGKDETVVAYEKNVPAEGGYVLLSAGTVKKMSTAEFAAAPKGGRQ
jgi:hypothetical protein